MSWGLIDVDMASECVQLLGIPPAHNINTRDRELLQMKYMTRPRANLGNILVQEIIGR